MANCGVWVARNLNLSYQSNSSLPWRELELPKTSNLVGFRMHTNRSEYPDFEVQNRHVFGFAHDQLLFNRIKWHGRDAPRCDR